jgi:hypothetical protein
MVEDWEWLECETKGEQRRYIKRLRFGPDRFKACRSALGKVVHVIHTHHVKRQGIDIDRIKVCGSVGKKTASTKSSDLDLVVFAHDILLEPGYDHSVTITNILDEIEVAMDRQYPGTKDKGWYRKYGLRYVIQGMEIAILIGATRVKPRDFLDIVDDSEQRDYMSVSVSHYSTRFTCKQGLFFKDMVRVIKDWNASWPLNCKPKSYLLGVLELHAIREALPKLYSERTHRVHSYKDYSQNVTRLLLYFLDMIGDIEPYRKGKSYTKEPVSPCVFFEIYYQGDEIPWDQPEPLFQSTKRITLGDKRENATTKTRYAIVVVLDPSNPTNNLWLTLANADPFIMRAKNTALALRD